MVLQLDSRQRAMLQEMGIAVWLPSESAQTLAPTPTPATVAPAQAGTTLKASSARPAVPIGQPAIATALPAKSVAVQPIAAVSSSPASTVQLDGLDWDALALQAAQCQACGLCEGRKHSTLQAAAGGRADWMVVGDPPDEDEDTAGQPFVGSAGVLLGQMFKAVGAQRLPALGGTAEAAPAIHAARGDAADLAGAGRVYVTQVVKCRPPLGRIPQVAELAQCAAYLQREIALVQPRIIVAMGRFATQVLLGDAAQPGALPLGKLRGVVHDYQGRAVVATYHPKLLLRTPADKAKAWADLCLALDTLERSVQSSA